MQRLFKILAVLALLGATALHAADLQEIKARGELRHLGIRYANFVTGSGDGFDVELVQGFARRIGVKYTLVYSDFTTSSATCWQGRRVRATVLAGDFPAGGDMTPPASPAPRAAVLGIRSRPSCPVMLGPSDRRRRSSRARA
jgi:hypothetical protein